MSSSDGGFYPAANYGANAVSTGDNVISYTYRACNADWVALVEGDFPGGSNWIDESNWSDKGHSTPCATETMYGRLMDATFVLGTSYPGSGSARGVLEDALEYSWTQLEQVRGRCSWETTTMLTSAGSYTRIAWGGAYSNSPSVRAAVLYHEARHGEGCVHDGNDGSPRCAFATSGSSNGGNSCDEKFGVTQSGEQPINIAGPGATSYGVYFAADYVFRGVLRRTDSSSYFVAPWILRRSAQYYGNSRLQNAFDQPTTIRINPTAFCDVGFYCPVNV